MVHKIEREQEVVLEVLERNRDVLRALESGDQKETVVMLGKLYDKAMEGNYKVREGLVKEPKDLLLSGIGGTSGKK